MTEGEFAPFIEGLIRAEEHDRKLLKPCPFCGCDDIMVWHCGMTKLVWMARCPNCLTYGPHTNTEDDAIKGWNRRVKE